MNCYDVTPSTPSTPSIDVGHVAHVAPTAKPSSIASASASPSKSASAAPDTTPTTTTPPTAAAAAAKAFTKRPTNDELLKLYGLFKQGSVGDVQGTQPWAVQLEARAKWDAWKVNEGTTQDAAKEKYIDYVDQLKANYA